VQLASGSILLGKLQPQNGQLMVETVNGALDISNDRIVGLWQEGEASPRERELQAAVAATARNWAYELSAGLTGKTGNTERLATSARLTAALTSPEDKLLFYASGDRAEENQRTTSKELRGGIDYEYVHTSGHSWYVRSELEYDEIEALDLRATAAAGYGYYFLRKPMHELRGRLGLSYLYESYTDGTTESSPGLDAGLLHRWDLGESTTLHNSVTYTPSFDDFGRFVLDHESSLEFDLATERDLALRLGVAHQYSSKPVAGKDRLDTTYFARLVLKWQ
jgi:putative salt-induced outer membrane protein YdiY